MRHVPVCVALLCVLLSNCIKNTDADTVHRQVDSYDRTLNDAATELNRAGPWIVMLCQLEGERSAECQDARNGHELASAAIDAARAGVDAYEATGVEVPALAQLMERLDRDVGNVRDAAARAAEVIGHVLADNRSQGASGDRPGVGDSAGAGDATGRGAQEGGASPSESARPATAPATATGPQLKDSQSMAPQSTPGAL